MHSARRTCIGCRRGRPQRELLRFRRREDGHIVLRRPQDKGRSFYLCPSQACLTAALRGRAIERSCKQVGKIVYDRSGLQYILDGHLQPKPPPQNKIMRLDQQDQPDQPDHPIHCDRITPSNEFVSPEDDEPELRFEFRLSRLNRGRFETQRSKNRRGLIGYGIEQKVCLSLHSRLQLLDGQHIVPLQESNLGRAS